MSKTWSIFVAFLAVALPASAASLTVKFVNMSDDSITRLAATPKNLPGATTERIFEHPIANGDSGEAFFAATAGDCVFTLTFTFASGKSLSRPDTDLCQTDRIVIE
jgi:hypothetical protein